jgi:hypothetical protein
VRRRDDLAFAVHRCEHVPSFVGNEQLEHLGQGPQAIAEGNQEIVCALARESADGHRTLVLDDEAFGGIGVDVDLVEDEHLRNVLGIDLGQHLVNRGDLPFGIGGARIDDVHEEVGFAGDFERGLECLDESVGQATHEADRVGDEHGLATGKRQPPRCRIECREQPVLDEHAGASELVQQRRLARVRVTDDRHSRQPAALATFALQMAIFLEILEVSFELGDAPHDAPAVSLELGFAGATGSDARALLGEIATQTTTEPRQAITQQCQFDLCLTFERVRVLGEDVEDHRGAIDRRAAELLFQVVLLRRS